MKETSAKRILIVDDEDAILFALSRVLSRDGIAVDTAQSEEEANRLLAENSYRAVVADLRLSGAEDMAGFRVVQAAKQNDPSTKVIVITAYGNSEIRERAFAAHADCYMEKPVSAGELRRVLLSLGIR